MSFHILRKPGFAPVDIITGVMAFPELTFFSLSVVNAESQAIRARCLQETLIATIAGIQIDHRVEVDYGFVCCVIYPRNHFVGILFQARIGCSIEPK